MVVMRAMVFFFEDEIKFLICLCLFLNILLMKSKEFGINVPLDLLKIYITKRHARYQTILLAQIKYIMSCLLTND